MRRSIVTLAAVLAIAAFACLLSDSALLGRVMPHERFCTEAIIGGGAFPRRIVRLNAESAAVSDDFKVFPGPALLALTVEGAAENGRAFTYSAPFQEGERTPAVKLLDRIVTIEPHRVLLDGRPIAALRPEDDELCFIERSGAVELLNARGRLILHFRQ